MRLYQYLPFVIFGLISAHAVGKTAEQIYAKVATSVVVVYSDGAKNRRQGSGVVVAPSQVITNCHVLEPGSTFSVVSGSKRYLAEIKYADTLRDICQIHVKGLSAPAVTITTKPARIGQRVYAIGTPQGLDRTLSDGLISAVRTVEAGFHMLQISAPITHGSSGGGLFDEEAKLIGITTSGIEGGQNLNFALPAELIALLPSAGKPFITDNTSQEEALADSIRIALSNAKADPRPPKARFDELNDRIKYSYWLGEMSKRLQHKLSDTHVRLDFLEAVWYEARRAGLDPAMVLGIIQLESNFHQFHMSKSGARGYMGVMPFWTRRVGDGDPAKLFHMPTNLRYGCSILRMHIDQEGGNLYLALSRYAGHPGRPEYPNAVLAEWKKFEYKR